MTRKQSDKHNTMFNVAANLKHVNNRENNNWRLVSALCVLDCCTVPCTHDWSHCDSSLCFVRLIVIVMSHAHVEWLTLRLLHLLHIPPFHSLQFLAHLSACHFPLPWCRGLKPRALPLRSWAPWTVKTPPQVMSPTTTSSQRIMSSSPRSPWPSNGPLKTSTTTTSQSVRRSSMRAEVEPISLKEKACRFVCLRRQWVMIERRNLLFVVTQVTRKVTKLRDKNFEHAQIRTLLDRQREQFLADCEAEIRKHEFQADDDRRSIQKRNETIESRKEELHLAQAEEQRRQDHQLLHVQLLYQNLDFREAL